MPSFGGKSRKGGGSGVSKALIDRLKKSQGSSNSGGGSCKKKPSAPKGVGFGIVDTSDNGEVSG